MQTLEISGRSTPPEWALQQRNLFLNMAGIPHPGAHYKHGIELGPTGELVAFHQLIEQLDRGKLFSAPRQITGCTDPL